MEENGQAIISERKHKEESEQQEIQKQRRRRCLRACCLVSVIFVLLISIVILILALTVFKVRQPKATVVSAKLDGVTPRISFPVINIQLNVSLDLQLNVENKNHASFKHGSGKSLVSYQGNQIGEADIPPGFIPAMGSTTVSCKLTLDVDEMASKTDLKGFIDDVLSGTLVVETRTRIPGRVNFLKIFKKHAVAISDCKITIAVLALKIQSQECKSKTKL
ncbi:Late embryogenesis abundant protein, LEA-14 [Corchorus capsularis]|uniref:Late embryogenesis abundant protein, LEA-14 n=1 Tax=Corchorus capsularis TaxID=210143 RepID=A0A1R3GPB4_COCAP|nr:Late embryogenesis abundant protein, LEA-14 [Corchorus capsularis]